MPKYNYHLIPIDDKQKFIKKAESVLKREGIVSFDYKSKKPSSKQTAVIRELKKTLVPGVILSTKGLLVLRTSRQPGSTGRARANCICLCGSGGGCGGSGGGG